MRSQNSGDVPIAADNLRDIAAVIPACRLRMRDKWARVTPRREAASLTLISPRYSLNTSPGCAGLKIIGWSFPVIVLVIHKDHVFAVETKCQPPITVDFDGPMAGEFSPQWMQVVGGRIHISRLAGHVQGSEQPSQPRGMHWLNPSLGASFGEELQPLVAIAPNHARV
jgi:hypothetical protein